MGKLVAKTALITLASIIALVLVLFGVFSLFFPSVMVSVTNALGMDSACASYSISVYRHSGKTDDLAAAVERCYYAERYGDASEYGVILLDAEDFEKYCSEKDSQNSESSFVRGSYAQYMTGLVAVSQYYIGDVAALDTAFGSVGKTFEENNAVVFLTSAAIGRQDKEACAEIFSRLSSLNPSSEYQVYFEEFYSSLEAYCKG